MEFILSSYNEAALRAILEASPETGHFLEHQADKIVAEAKLNVSIPFVSMRLGGKSIHGERTLSPKFPYPKLRTGDLQQSIRRTSAGSGIEQDSVEVVAIAVHYGWPYPRTLHERGYQLITDADIEALHTMG